MRKTDDRIVIVDAVCDVETGEKPFGRRWHQDEITLRPEHLAGAAGPEKQEKAVIEEGKAQLREQQAEAAKLDAAIVANLKELGFWEEAP